MGDVPNEGEERVTRFVGRGLAEAMRSEDFDALRAWVCGHADEVLAAFPGEAPPAGPRARTRCAGSATPSRP